MSLRSNALRFLAAVPVALTVTPWSQTGRGWVRVWDFPRLQITTWGLLSLSLLLRWGNRERTDTALCAALGMSLAYQGKKIVRYTRLFPKQAQTAQKGNLCRRIRVLIANVWMYNRDAAGVLGNIRNTDPDLVCLVETDAWWERETRGLEEGYPWFNKCPLENTYGMLLYSRLPMESQTRFLVEDDVPSMRSTVTLSSDDKIVVYSIHPRPPRFGTPTYGRDAELVLVGREVDHERTPAIVMGDLNDVAWSYTTTLFQRVSHLLDPRVGRGMYNTFHARHPLVRYPLDHVFHSKHFKVAQLERLPPAGSDHFAILVELSYTPGEQNAEIPHLSTNDAEQSEKILDAAARRNLI